MRRLLLLLALILCLISSSQAAPCYGTKMPEQKQFFMGLQTHIIFKRYLEDDFGKLRSTQNLFLISYGVYDWLSIDLKGGAGNIKQHPSGSDEIHYPSNFSGGYGFRLKFLDQDNIKMVFGFQHISAHPGGKYVGSIKNKAILDDWQTSVLASYDFKKITPYFGTRWSRVDYIHKVGNNSSKRKMSDAGKSFGLIAGFDLPLAERFWLNLEGSAFDSEAFAFSLNYKF